MFDLADIQNAKKKLSEKRNDNSGESLNKGIEILESYKVNPDIDKLDQAGKLFIEALQFNKHSLEALIYLSYVFYALDNPEMALKYFKMLEDLEQNLPAEFIKYKETIIQRLDKVQNYV